MTVVAVARLQIDIRGLLPSVLCHTFIAVCALSVSPQHSVDLEVKAAQRHTFLELLCRPIRNIVALRNKGHV